MFVTCSPSLLIPEQLERAVELLKMGELVAFPTDTVYGVGGKPAEQTFDALFAIKKRSRAKPIVLLLHDLEQLSKIAPVERSLLACAEAFWPGALTLILPAFSGLPREVRKDGKVAVRISAHPIARALSSVGPLATSSANISGFPTPSTAGEVCRQLGKGLAAAVIGHCPLGLPSTVLDMSSNQPKVIRRGTIDTEKIAAVLKTEVEI